MIHRLLHTIMTAGIATIEDDITVLDDLFERNYVLEDSEVEAIKEYFLDHPPEIINGYARQDSNFPLIAITLATEGESETFLADDAGPVLDEDSPYINSDIASAIWSHTYNFLVYTDHPDITVYYYEIVKMILLGGFPVLIDDGCFDFSMNGGDLAPDPKYLPQHLFGRQLTFSCQRELQILDRNSRFLKAFRLDGIYVDSSGSSSDVGDVKTNVTTYGTGSDE